MNHLLSILLLLSTLLSQYDQLFVGTRPLSMGGAFIAVADDANAITWNPAGLPGLRRTELLQPTQIYIIWASHNLI